VDVDWQPIETAPENVVVKTMIADGDGVRNFAKLRRRGRLWWFPDGSMYVYYTPTHWSPEATGRE
jgi:hypothetical protein